VSIEVRPFRRSDREQLTTLVNAHVAAVIPGVSVSTNTVLSQIEREPGEFIVDPWVTERTTLVAVERDRVVAAAHLRRYGTTEEVGEAYRDTGEIAWLLAWPDAPYWPDHGAGNELAARCVEQLRRWGVGRMYADGALPAPGVYGVPEQWPHIRSIYGSNSFVYDGHLEIVLLAVIDDIPPAPVLPDTVVARRVGINGTRLSAYVGDDEAGFIEVDTELARGSALSRYAGWADIGNLHVADAHRADEIRRWLIATAADWLRLGRIDRLLAYADETEEELATFLREIGFREITRTQRGWIRRDG
jgi:GNAT superfamily N-acetyltransferase